MAEQVYSDKDKQWLRRKLLKYEDNHNKTQFAPGFAKERRRRENQQIKADIEARGLLDCDLECSTRQFLLKNEIDD